MTRHRATYVPATPVHLIVGCCVTIIVVCGSMLVVLAWAATR